MEAMTEFPARPAGIAPPGATTAVARGAISSGRREILQLLASPAHRFTGRPSDGPAPAPPGERVERVEIRAGLGIVGDRYFGKPAHRDAGVTIIAAESLPPGADLTHVRRNILVQGVAVDDLVGATISLDSGDGPVLLRINRRANPCAWMDATIGPGAWRALRGKGGVRCTPLNDGVLKVGPVQVELLEAVGVGEHVEGGDPPAHHSEDHDEQRPVVGHHRHAGGAVDEGPPDEG